MQENFDITGIIFIFFTLIVITFLLFIPLHNFRKNKIFLIITGAVFLLSFSALKIIAHYSAIQNFLSFGWMFFTLITVIAVTVFSPVILPLGKLAFIIKAKPSILEPSFNELKENELTVSKEILKAEQDNSAEELAEEVNFFPDKSVFGITTEADLAEQPSEVKNQKQTADKPAVKKKIQKPGVQKHKPQKKTGSARKPRKKK